MLIPQLFCDGHAGQRVILHAQLQVSTPGADAQVRVDQQRAAQIVCVKTVRCVSQKDNGEFKSLGAVNAEDTHGVCCFPPAFRHLGLNSPLNQFIQMIQKRKKTFVARGFKAMGPVQEQHQICLPLPSFRHGAEHGGHGGFLIDPAQKRVRRKVCGHQAQRGKLPEKGGGLYIPGLGALTQCTVKICFPVL